MPKTKAPASKKEDSSRKNNPFFTTQSPENHAQQSAQVEARKSPQVQHSKTSTIAPSGRALRSGQTVIQRKIHLGPAGDRYEQEADRFAKQFGATNGPSNATPTSFSPSKYHSVSSGAEAVSPTLERAIQKSPNSGTPLPQTLSQRASSGLNHNLDSVRIHNNTHADSLNRSLNSRAFTTGRDIYFRSGEYQPSSSSGQQLIAHELTHVAQQSTSNQSGAKSSVLQCARYSANQEVKQLFDGATVRITSVIENNPFGDSTYAIEDEYGFTGTIRDSEIASPSLPSSGFFSPSGFGTASFPPPAFQPTSTFSSSTFSPPSSNPFGRSPPNPLTTSTPNPFGTSPPNPFAPVATSPFQSTAPSTFDFDPGPTTSSFASGFALGPSTSRRLSKSESRARRIARSKEQQRLEKHKEAAEQRKRDKEMRQSEWYRMAYRKREREYGADTDYDYDTMLPAAKRRRLEASPQEIGERVQEEILWLIDQVDDTQELASFFPYLQQDYGLTRIGYKNLGTPDASVAFKINPSFEVKLNGAKNKIEMRSEGTSSGKYQSKVKWVPQQLSIIDYSKATKPTLSVTVGGTMNANPLSYDHPAGTLAKADTEQKWMSLVPTQGKRAMTGSGSGDYFDIKGHLLNDNLGGIANEANLYPITADANHIHSNDVEEYIKNGIDNGYVYEYNVKVNTISVKETKFLNAAASGTPTTITLNAIDANMEFQFSRLDSSLQPIAKTTHKGVIKSRYQGPITSGSSSGASVHPFTKKHDEYKHDYTGGKSANPFAVGGEAIFKPGSQLSPLTSNSGLVTDIGSGSFSITPPLATVLGGFGASSGPVQSINAGYTPAASLAGANGKLSLRKSTKALVENYYSGLVPNWSKSDIGKWVDSLNTNNVTKWADVQTKAILNKLNPTIAADIFNTSKPYIKNVSISGKAG